MSNNFSKDFDTIKTEILADFQNLSPSPDISQGSPVNINATLLAAGLWTIYKYLDWLDKQRMPGDQADTDELNKWGIKFGIPRLTNETDADYSARMVGMFRQPPAGGTAKDYLNWALSAVPSGGIPANLAEQFLPTAVDTGADTITFDGTHNPYGWVNNDPIVFTSTGSLPGPLVSGQTYYSIRQDSTAIQVSTSSGGSVLDLISQGTGIHLVSHAVQPAPDPNSFFVENATIITPNSIPIPTAPGTVSAVLVPNDERILDPSYAYYPAVNALTQTTAAYIEARRPVTAGVNFVAMEDTTNYSIIMTVSPVTAPVLTIQQDVMSYVNSLTPGAVLYKVQLEAIALRDGAVNATVTSPTFNVYGQLIPDSTTAIRTNSATINVSA